MSLLANLTSDSSIAAEKDSVGGGGFGPLESGLYNCTISTAYLNKAGSGALGLVLELKTEDGKDIKQTLWMTSGTAKGGTNYYTDKNGAKQFLPGFNHANGLCILAAGKEISQMDAEKKVVKAYSIEAKADVPTHVDMLVDLIGKQVAIGLLKQTVDKTAKNDAGFYIPTGETKEENEIDKIFRGEDLMTVAEIKAKAEEAAFAATWKAKHTGVTRNKAKGAAAGAGTAGAPVRSGAAPSTATKKPAQSLFA